MLERFVKPPKYKPPKYSRRLGLASPNRNTLRAKRNALDRFNLAREEYLENRASQEMLLEADLVDKISQIIARVRGFRDRPDSDVVVYLWDHVQEIHKKGKFPFVWLNEALPLDSIVGQIYNRRQPLRKNVEVIADRIHELKLEKKFYRQNEKFKKVKRGFRRNLGAVANALGL